MEDLDDWLQDNSGWQPRQAHVVPPTTQQHYTISATSDRPAHVQLGAGMLAPTGAVQPVPWHSANGLRSNTQITTAAPATAPEFVHEERSESLWRSKRQRLLPTYHQQQHQTVLAGNLTDNQLQRDAPVPDETHADVLHTAAAASAPHTVCQDALWGDDESDYMADNRPQQQQQQQMLAGQPATAQQWLLSQHDTYQIPAQHQAGTADASLTFNGRFSSTEDSSAPSQLGQDDADADDDHGAAAAAEDDSQEDEQDIELVSADFDVSRDEVIQRIEQLAVQLVTAAAAGELPQLTCISTAASNVHMAQQHATATAAGGGYNSQAAPDATEFNPGSGSLRNSTQQEQQDEGAVEQQDVEDDQWASSAVSDAGQQQQVLRLGSRTQTRTLLSNGGAQAHVIVRVLQLLDVVHSLLRSGRTATQRDLYYTLLGPPFFSHAKQLTSTIQTALTLLRLPRASLGIAAASKGAVAGRLLLRARPVGESWQDCSLTGPAGRAIPGEVGAIQAMQLKPNGARFILVVEKDAVFQRLVEDRLFDQLPCIIITGRGMPDIASRAFLAALVAATSSNSDSWDANSAAASCSSVPVLGLVDWNPGGVAILLTYKHGSAQMGLEAARYAVPHLAWLGVTSDMLEDVPRSACQALTPRDKTQITNLKARLESCPDWVVELEEMEGLGLKADIEALYSVMGHGALTEELVKRVLQRQYLN